MEDFQIRDIVRFTGEGDVVGATVSIMLPDDEDGSELRQAIDVRVRISVHDDVTLRALEQRLLEKALSTARRALDACEGRSAEDLRSGS